MAGGCGDSRVISVLEDRHRRVPELDAQRDQPYQPALGLIEGPVSLKKAEDGLKMTLDTNLRLPHANTHMYLCPYTLSHAGTHMCTTHTHTLKAEKRYLWSTYHMPGTPLSVDGKSIHCLWKEVVDRVFWSDRSSTTEACVHSEEGSYPSCRRKGGPGKDKQGSRIDEQGQLGAGNCGTVGHSYTWVG